jgi:hypothetical protein
MLVKVISDPVSDEVVDNFLKKLSEVVEGVRAGEITPEYLMSFM